MTEKLLPRKILPKIIKYLDEEGIILLIGARQVGKTSILNLLIESLKNKGVAENTIRYFPGLIVGCIWPAKMDGYT